MNVKTLCLAILSGGESTGYEIRKLSTEGHYSHFVDASYGSIYPALTRMEEDGLVESREEVQKGKPSRKVYSITDAGRAAFVSALKKPIQRDIFKSNFMLVCMFAHVMSKADVSAAIETQLAHLRGELETIDRALAENDTPTVRWVAGYGHSCITRSLEFIEQNRGTLEALAETGTEQGAYSVAAE